MAGVAACPNPNPNPNPNPSPSPSPNPIPNPLWQAWLQVQRLTRTGQHALFFWSDDELALLEEEP